MNIKPYLLGSAMAFAILCPMSSCDDSSSVSDPSGKTTDSTALDPYGDPYYDPYEPAQDPLVFTPRNEDAIQKALLASKVLDYNRYYSPELYSNYKDFLYKVSVFSKKAAVAIGAQDNENTAVSPISIFMALAMAAESASGDTRQEILDVLGVTCDELSANIKYLCQTCNEILDSHNPFIELKCVNSIWVQNGMQVKDAAIGSLTNNFFADVFSMDFEKSDVSDLVSSYIHNETHGILSPDLEITPDVLIMLMNVVYLRDVWGDSGAELSITDNKYNFLCSNNDVSCINLLQGYYHSGRVVETEKMRKFYTQTNNYINLTFYVPKDGYSIDDIYTEEVLTNGTDYEYERRIDSVNYRYFTRCIFPEFDACFDGQIKKVLQKMGIMKLFSQACDFSSLTSQPVYCSDVRHVSKLEVNRGGIKGAAITALSMNGSAGPSEEVWKDVYEDFVVDRNFAFVLSREGVPLFTGVVKSIK